MRGDTNGGWPHLLSIGSKLLVISLVFFWVHKLLIYKRITENRVAVGFLGFNTDPEVEVEVQGNTPMEMR